jgi:hypothetical protein
MLDILAQVGHEKSIAWRVEFRGSTGAVPAGAIEVKSPRHVIGELRPIDIAAALAAATPQTDTSLTIIWIPPNGRDGIGIELDAELWLRGAHVSGNGGVVRAGVRTVRIFCTPSRALIYASREHLASALDAVVRFTVAQRETIALEKEMDSAWAAIEVDAPLAHSISASQQKRQAHVDAMTVAATRMKAKFLRISQALEQIDPALEDSSKRIYAELVLAGNLHDRLELVDNPVQFTLDHYEIANTRLNEARFARKEQRDAMIGHVSQVVIVMLLLIPLLSLEMAGSLGQIKPWIDSTIKQMTTSVISVHKQMTTTINSAPKQATTAASTPKDAATTETVGTK